MWAGRGLSEPPRVQQCPLVLRLTCPLRAPFGRSGHRTARNLPLLAVPRSGHHTPMALTVGSRSRPRPAPPRTPLSVECQDRMAIRLRAWSQGFPLPARLHTQPALSFLLAWTQPCLGYGGHRPLLSLPLGQKLSPTSENEL